MRFCNSVYEKNPHHFAMKDYHGCYEDFYKQIIFVIPVQAFTMKQPKQYLRRSGETNFHQHYCKILCEKVDFAQFDRLNQESPNFLKSGPHWLKGTKRWAAINNYFRSKPKKRLCKKNPMTLFGGNDYEKLEDQKKGLCCLKLLSFEVKIRIDVIITNSSPKKVQVLLHIHPKITYSWVHSQAAL